MEYVMKRIGIVGSQNLKRDMFVESLIGNIPHGEIKKIVHHGSHIMSCELVDGTMYYVLSARDHARGFRFTKIYADEQLSEDDKMMLLCQLIPSGDGSEPSITYF